MSWRCDFCDCDVVPNGGCPSCALYNAAIDAQRAAANRIAKDHDPRATDAYLNEYGVFARIRNQVVQVGSPEQAAPFVALTNATRQVKFPGGMAFVKEAP